MRVPLTVVDWSVPLVQNLFLLGRDPGLWGKAAYHGAMRFQDPKFMQQFITEKRASVHRMIQSGVLFRSSDVMHGLEEGDWLAGYAVRGIEKLPVGEAAQTALKTGPWGVTKLLKTFGNVYEVQLDVAKIFLWESLEHMAIDAKSKADLGAFVNKATGTLPGGAFGVSRTQQQAESGIFFFAPAYTRAHSALLVDAISQGGVRGEVARDSIAKLFMFLVHTHIAGASLTGAQPNLDPTKSGDFLKLEVEGHRLGLNNKAMSLMKTGFNMFVKGVTEPDLFIQDEFWKRELLSQNPAFKFIWAQASVPAGLATDFTLGTDFLGKTVPGLDDGPHEMLKYLGKKTMPFWAGGMLEANETLPPAHKQSAYIAGIAEGLGIQAFPNNAGTYYTRMRDEASQKKYGKPWEELVESRPQEVGTLENTLLGEDEELRELYELTRSQLRERTVIKKSIEYDDAVVGAQTTRRRTEVELAKTLDRDFRINDQASRAFKEGMRRAALEYRGHKDRIDQQYPEVREAKKKYAEENQTEEGEAFAQFYEALGSPVEEGGVLMADGSTDRLALKEMKDEIDAEYGEGTIRRITKLLYNGRMAAVDVKGEPLPLTATLQQWFYSQLALEEYWNAYVGVVPPELESAFVQWDALSPDEKKYQAFSNPNAFDLAYYEAMVDMKRLDMKMEDPEIDKLLWKFHGIIPSNFDNFDPYLDHLMAPLDDANR